MERVVAHTERLLAGLWCTGDEPLGTYPHEDCHQAYALLRKNGVEPSAITQLIEEQIHLTQFQRRFNANLYAI